MSLSFSCGRVFEKGLLPKFPEDEVAYGPGFRSAIFLAAKTITRRRSIAEAVQRELVFWNANNQDNAWLSFTITGGVIKHGQSLFMTRRHKVREKSATQAAKTIPDSLTNATLGVRRLAAALPKDDYLSATGLERFVTSSKARTLPASSTNSTMQPPG